MPGDTEPRVLVADDDAQVRRVLDVALRQAGLGVTLASDGAEAVRLFREAGGFDVVLLDVQMPGMDGPATLVALRAADPGVRAVFMTGDKGGYDSADLLGAGALHILAKPFPSLAAVAALLAEVARKSSTE